MEVVLLCGVILFFLNLDKVAEWLGFDIKKPE